MTTEPALLPVIQADREAAAHVARLLTGAAVEHIREGFEDGTGAVQAFARHRLALSPALSQGDVERVARAIDPSAWKRRDEDVSRRDEYDRQIKAAYYGAPFEEWRDRSVVSSIERARAAIAAMPVSAGYREGVEAAAKVAMNPGWIDARDTEWDAGVNYAKGFIATKIRALSDDDGKEGR